MLVPGVIVMLALRLILRRLLLVLRMLLRVLCFRVSKDAFADGSAGVYDATGENCGFEETHCWFFVEGGLS